ncbi:MAG: hypothetical protein PUB98_06030 [Clostridiales bacterium]|nr:hypothetical protein [Clostridiales bacterium]
MKHKFQLVYVYLFSLLILTGCSSKEDISAGSISEEDISAGSISEEDISAESSLDETIPDVIAPEKSLSEDSDTIPNPYQDLCVPTYFTKVKDFYFLVDCYHDQVLYNDTLTGSVSEWKVLPGKLSQPHTIASDGEFYLVDDTENHRVLVYQRHHAHFEIVKEFHNIGVRPHYIQYHEETETFYVWSSMTGEMYLFSSDSQQISLEEVRKIPQLEGVYVRSFTILGDEIYFVSGNCTILRAKLSDFTILEEYPVPDSMASMIQLTKIGSMFYITVSTDKNGNQAAATILRTEDLHSLQDGHYEDIYDLFVRGGTPYYISQVEDSYYLTEHRILGHSLWRFQVNDDKVEHIEAIY